ncbi:hypothetical protein HAX54_007938, partial [Datura stramonium]|nr:hypothetical protein [Datura stramonium]
VPRRRIRRFVEPDMRAIDWHLRTAYPSVDGIKRPLLRPERGYASHTIVPAKPLCQTSDPRHYGRAKLSRKAQVYLRSVQG